MRSEIALNAVFEIKTRAPDAPPRSATSTKTSVLTIGVNLQRLSHATPSLFSSPAKPMKERADVVAAMVDQYKRSG